MNESYWAGYCDASLKTQDYDGFNLEDYERGYFDGLVDGIDSFFEEELNFEELHENYSESN